MQKRVIAIIEQFPNGATAEDINSELEATTKEAKKPIAAAISRLRTRGAIGQDAPRQPWKLVPAEREAFEPPSGDAAA